MRLYSLEFRIKALFRGMNRSNSYGLALSIGLLALEITHSGFFGSLWPIKLLLITVKVQLAVCQGVGLTFVSVRLLQIWLKWPVCLLKREESRLIFNIKLNPDALDTIW